MHVPATFSYRPLIRPTVRTITSTGAILAHSVNLMAVCDANKKFTYCFAGYPGSVHYQRVFANSALGHFLPPALPKQPLYHIVGDSAFQLQPHMMVPYRDTGALTVAQLNYNKKLTQTRRHIVENAFGFLKRRFRHLKRLECNCAVDL